MMLLEVCFIIKMGDRKYGCFKDAAVYAIVMAGAVGVGLAGHVLSSRPSEAGLVDKVRSGYSVNRVDDVDARKEWRYER